MQQSKISLKEAKEFHGHLGPYLILGLLMGDLAINKLRCKKHFGIEAIVKGAINKPKSCLIDGIQISTGCTYGKGNIQKMNSKAVVGLFHNLKNNKKIRISLKKDLVDELNNLKGHRDSEMFARKLFKTNPLSLFELKF